MIHTRYCLKCGRAYDIGTNFEICAYCRGVIKKDNKKRGKKGEENLLGYM